MMLMISRTNDDILFQTLVNLLRTISSGWALPYTRTYRLYMEWVKMVASPITELRAVNWAPGVYTMLGAICFLASSFGTDQSHTKAWGKVSRLIMRVVRRAPWFILRAVVAYHRPSKTECMLTSSSFYQATSSVPLSRNFIQNLDIADIKFPSSLKIKLVKTVMVRWYWNYKW